MLHSDHGAGLRPANGKPVPGRAARACGWPYRANVATRALAGTLGAYAVAAMTAAMLARILPLSRAEAVTTATMIAYLVAPAVTVWSFLARGPVRAMAGAIVLTLALAIIAWYAGPRA